MTTLEMLRSRRREIETLAHNYCARNIRIFGSVARGEDTSESDIDFLVDMGENSSLLDLVGLHQDLTAALGRPAEVLTVHSISPYLRNRILSEALPL